MDKPSGAQAPRRKLLFFVTEDYYFVSHRLALAVAAREAGYEVTVVTRVRECGDIIKRSGFTLIPLDNARSSVNALTDLPLVIRLARVYRRERPDIVHHVAMKPVLYGSLAARLSGRPRTINALTGMGWLFTSTGGLATWLKLVVRRALRYAARSGLALVQNADDAALLTGLGVPAEQIRIIAGSGVDVRMFAPRPFAPEPPVVVVMHARLLWDKGVGEYVAAARELRERGIRARFLLAGEPDAANPASIPPAQVDQWKTEGAVEFLGQVDDVPSLLAAAHVVCLPSYREGLPKSLIEAAAAGRPIVTTDVPGCRAVVRHGESGLLVPARDAHALARALETLIGDPAMRRSMGACGRQRAEHEFAAGVVVGETLALYREVMA